MVKVRVDDLWATTIPGGAVLVCAGVLMAGAPAVASAREQGHEAHALTWVVGAMTPKPIQKAPTCGPCCHGMPSCDRAQLAPKPDPIDPVDTTTTGEANLLVAVEPDDATTTTGDGAQVSSGELAPSTSTSSDAAQGPDTHKDEGAGVQGPPAIAKSGCRVTRSGGELPTALGLLGLGALVVRHRRRHR